MCRTTILLAAVLATATGMAFSQTRMYFPATTAGPTGVTPTPVAGWNDTGGLLRRSLVRAKGTSTITTGSTISGGALTAGRTYLDRQYISDPLIGGAISGTVSMQLMTREFANQHNVDRCMVAIRVVSNNGTTVRGTLYALGSNGPTLEFINNATLRNKTCLNAATLSSVTAQAGDRIVVEVGYSNSTAATSGPQGAAGKWGENATDLPVNETQTTNGAPWIQFSQNIGFAYTGTVSGETLTTSDTTTASNGVGYFGNPAQELLPQNFPKTYDVITGTHGYVAAGGTASPEETLSLSDTTGGTFSLHPAPAETLPTLDASATAVKASGFSSAPTEILSGSLPPTYETVTGEKNVAATHGVGSPSETLTIGDSNTTKFEGHQGSSETLSTASSSVGTFGLTRQLTDSFSLIALSTGQIVHAPADITETLPAASAATVCTDITTGGPTENFSTLSNVTASGVFQFTKNLLDSVSTSAVPQSIANLNQTTIESITLADILTASGTLHITQNLTETLLLSDVVGRAIGPNAFPSETFTLAEIVSASGTLHLTVPISDTYLTVMGLGITVRLNASPTEGYGTNALVLASATGVISLLDSEVIQDVTQGIVGSARTVQESLTIGEHMTAYKSSLLPLRTRRTVIIGM